MVQAKAHLRGETEPAVARCVRQLLSSVLSRRPGLSLAVSVSEALGPIHQWANGLRRGHPRWGKCHYYKIQLLYRY